MRDEVLATETPLYERGAEGESGSAAAS